ncbi:MAG: hypothetical protein AAFO89_02705 [Planctomycetota bacterium]
MPLQMVIDLEGPPAVARYREIVAVIMLTGLVLKPLRRPAHKVAPPGRGTLDSGDQPK